MACRGPGRVRRGRVFRQRIGLALLGLNAALSAQQVGATEEPPAQPVAELLAALGSGDAPEAWKRIAAAFDRPAPPAKPSEQADWARWAERYQLALLLAERPLDVLTDFAGREELRDDAAVSARVLGAEYAGWYGWQLAEKLFQNGRLTTAESVTGWMLEELAGSDGFAAPAPRIHILRAEVARSTGRWRDVDGEIEAGEGALKAIESLAQDPQRQAYYYEDLARLRGHQAQVQIELGLPDRAKALLDEADLAAQKAPNAVLATHLVRVDWLLLREEFQQVIKTVRPLRLAGGPTVLLLVEGLASLELEREGKTPEPGASELFGQALASGSLDVAVRFAAKVYLADALFIELARRPDDADLEAQLRKALTEARELASETWGPDEPPPEEEGVLAVLEWRCSSEKEKAKARERLLTAYHNLLSAWSASQLRPGGLGFLQHQVWRTRVISATVDAELAVSPGEAGKRAALERLFEVQTLGSIARAFDLPPCTLEEARKELLAPGEGCLVFLPAPDASHLFLFDGSTLQHHRLPEVDVLQGWVEEAHVHMGVPGEEAARALRDALFPPAARKWIESHHALTLVGFGLLPKLQVEDLPAWESKRDAVPPPALCARFAVTSLPSVPLGLYLARRARARGGPASGLVLAVNADPRGVAELKPFAFGDQELRELSAAFPPDRTRFIADASRADLAGLSGERHAIVHVLCHGAWDHGQEVGAALILASDAGADLVHPDDLPELDVDLLILTACDAQRGPQRMGDDLAATLGGQALAKGASCVLVGDGRVEVGAALKMGAALTRELATGASPAEALRRATAKMPEHASRARYRVLGLGHAPVDAGR